MQAGQCVLIAHAARKAQRVDQGRLTVGILMIAAPAGGGPQMGRVYGDDCAHAAFRVVEDVNRLVIVEGGQIEHGHARAFA